MDYVSRLKARKSELGMTNEQLSEASGVPMGTLSKLLAGMNDSPKLGNLVALCEAMELSLDYVVFGRPENTHNYTLSSDEIAWIETLRALDARGRENISALLEAERGHVGGTRTAQILRPVAPHRPAGRAETQGDRYLPLYSLPVSAGTGAYLDESSTVEMRVPPQANPSADFLLRVSGDSMEPRYHDRDLVLVSRADRVDEGEIGIFILNGEGYIKRWGGDCLISLNPAYAPIPVNAADTFLCCGRVVGRMRAKKD